MKATATDFPGLFVLEPKVFGDERGFFYESYSRRALAELGLDAGFLQDNHAYSRDPGVLRGFHFQAPPMAQTKLVRVTRGRVLDAVVDLRLGSPTMKGVFSIELSAKNRLQLYIPKGFAHAYLGLTPDVEFLYKVDAPYSPENEGGIAWNDPDISMDWPAGEPVLSDKDRELPLLWNFETPFVFEG